MDEMDVENSHLAHEHLPNNSRDSYICERNRNCRSSNMFLHRASTANSVQSLVHSRTRNARLQSHLWRSQSAPIGLIFNAPMSTHPPPPHSHFAHQHRARQRLHATRNRNLLMYSTATVCILELLFIPAVHLHLDYPGGRSDLCGRAALSHVLRRHGIRWYPLSRLYIVRPV